MDPVLSGDLADEVSAVQSKPNSPSVLRASVRSSSATSARGVSLCVRGLTVVIVLPSSLTQVNAGPGPWANLHPEIVHKSKATLERGALTRIVTAGDFMYLPSSHIHQVVALEDSISLTVHDVNSSVLMTTNPHHALL